MGTFLKVATVQNIHPEEGKMCELPDGKQIAIFKTADGYSVLNNVCPHRGGPIAEGRIENGKVSCPWHGWQFDVCTGVSPVNPNAKLRKYPCKVEGSDILIEID